jgi:hypothetical protein
VTKSNIRNRQALGLLDNMTRHLLEQNGTNGAKEIQGYVLLDKHGLSDWRISFENLRNAMYAPNAGDEGYWGQCDLKTKASGLIIASVAGSGRPCSTKSRTLWLASRGTVMNGSKKASEIGCTDAHFQMASTLSLSTARSGRR